jgi:SAM-dependent methyltransferase
MTQPEFDRFATSYNADLARSLVATGEAPDFYARARTDWAAQCVANLQHPVQRILDYGCGTGGNTSILAAAFKAGHVLGVDISSLSIAEARQSSPGGPVSFLATSDWIPDGTIHLAFTNGVFHHIPPPERLECLHAIRRALTPGGLFAFWENNPWNLGTRYVMSQCVFDENAIPISPPHALRILRQAGFEVLRTDFLFFFPRPLKWLRPIERWLRILPLGGQYQVLCRNPAA